ncbi:MAG: cupin domain-containing protein [Gibbsiella quercinecans]|uniref:Cupin n=1 Tax=Gibbsiella quercinecans TaxID=929813 RepID=A0A250B250_9GAMM|nr:cupin domain-containing protein [Gibbsiella quercinecans]ATA20171.1 cupin [Gibbsiella quercinecans]RLM07810.1 cupin [Gibbsiella quercinecans]RLM07986.1 cupin [Gibbsiella quercinecans]RLM08976.1 cupin [Gibbsiella quercinecans]TCT86560.1 mannose-6-phosphate isomerase-like protein (cupin superfamily) [Gibbsiella quercinecans]
MNSFRLTNAADAQVFRISPNDTNYFAVLFDRQQDGIDNIFVVEIFTVGGATPPNEHPHAHEFFYVLHGEGVASCNGDEVAIRQGDALLLHPGNEHLIRNTGSGKLYTLTVMTPNEGFAELIRSGEPMQLDEEDLRVLIGG